MTENDTDIDFDFFEDEPPTQETSRTERLIPRRGPRGPQQPPRTPTNLTPLLRLIGLIAFAILIVVLLVFWVQSCQASSKDKTYKSYMGKVSDVAGSSQQIGKQLSSVLLQPGLKESQLEQRVSGLARQEQLDVQRARAITPPGTLRDEHQALIQALQFRVSGLNGLASALAATANTKDATRAGTVLASQMQRLLASDVIYEDSFKAPSSAELTRQGVTGTNDAGGPLVPDSNFLQSSDLVTPTAMVTVINRIRGGTTTPSTGGLRGTNLVSVKVQPAGTELSTSTQTTVVRADEHVVRRDGRGLGRLAGGEHPGHAHDRPGRSADRHQARDDRLHQPGRAEDGQLHELPGAELRIPGADQGRGAARPGRVQHGQQLGRLSGHLLRPRP